MPSKNKTTDINPDLLPHLQELNSYEVTKGHKPCGIALPTPYYNELKKGGFTQIMGMRFYQTHGNAPVIF